MPDQGKELFVSGELRRNIYLTVKEALHNIVKHSGATKVCIQICVDAALEIVIRDNGSGFDYTHIRPFSNGLDNMRRRMAAIGGRFTIDSHEGTEVRLSMPLG
jgi:signal transduction histidine kinase